MEKYADKLLEGLFLFGPHIGGMLLTFITMVWFTAKRRVRARFVDDTLILTGAGMVLALIVHLFIG